MCSNINSQDAVSNRNPSQQNEKSYIDLALYESIVGHDLMRYFASPFVKGAGYGVIAGAIASSQLEIDPVYLMTTCSLHGSVIYSLSLMLLQGKSSKKKLDEASGDLTSFSNDITDNSSNLGKIIEEAEFDFEHSLELRKSEAAINKINLDRDHIKYLELKQEGLL
jgi:hypothetical protein